MEEAEVASAWDDQYAAGRYVGEAPVDFVADILAAARETGLSRPRKPPENPGSQPPASDAGQEDDRAEQEGAEVQEEHQRRQARQGERAHAQERSFDLWRRVPR